MIKDHHKPTLNANFELNGTTRVRLKLLEELSELLAEFCKYRFKKGSQDEISKEFADVVIVLSQLGISIDLSKNNHKEDSDIVQAFSSCISIVNSNWFIQEHDFYFLGSLKKYLNFTLVEETIDFKVNRLASRLGIKQF